MKKKLSLDVNGPYGVCATCFPVWKIGDFSSVFEWHRFIVLDKFVQLTTPTKLRPSYCREISI